MERSDWLSYGVRRGNANKGDIDPLPARELNFKTQDNRVTPLLEASCAFRVKEEEEEDKKKKERKKSGVNGASAYVTSTRSSGGARFADH